MDVLSQDLRVALRRIQRAPALATAIVLTIGLGLGAAAAIFTTSDAALVEPLPYAEPQRLVHLWEVRAGTAERSPTSYPTLLDWRSRAKSFSALEAYDPTNITVGMGDEARMLRGAQLTAGFFRLLGVRIPAGRDFLHGEDATTGAAVAIVTDRFARAVAGGSALDQTIVVNGTPCTLVGVLPPAFHFALLQNADVFVPLIADEQRRANRFNRSVYVLGRLQDHVPLGRRRIAGNQTLQMRQSILFGASRSPGGFDDVSGHDIKIDEPGQRAMPDILEFASQHMPVLHGQVGMLARLRLARRSVRPC